MLKFNKKLIILILLSLLLFSGCSASDPAPTAQEASTEINGYRIVYSQTANDYVLMQAKKLRSELEKLNGAEVVLSNDWCSEDDYGSSVCDGNYITILFGDTSHPESQSIYSSWTDKDEYVIKTENGKIIVAATSEKLLSEANYMLVTHIKNGDADTKKSTTLSKEEYSFFKIAQKDYSDVNILVADDAPRSVVMLSQYAADLINASCNTSVKVMSINEAPTTDGMIIIGASENKDVKELLDFADSDLSVVGFKNGRLIVSGKNENAEVNAICRFICGSILLGDRKNGEEPYIYFRADHGYVDKWDESIPKFPYGKVVSDKIQGNVLAERITEFSGVKRRDIKNYIEILKLLDFEVVTEEVNDYSESYKISSDVIDARLTYSIEEYAVEMRIFSKGRSNLRIIP